jgi:hypothetical protein
VNANDPLTRVEEEFRRMLKQPARLHAFAVQLRSDWLARQPIERQAYWRREGLGIEPAEEDNDGW